MKIELHDWWVKTGFGTNAFWHKNKLPCLWPYHSDLLHPIGLQGGSQKNFSWSINWRFGVEPMYKPMQTNLTLLMNNIYFNLLPRCMAASSGSIRDILSRRHSLQLSSKDNTWDENLIVFNGKRSYNCKKNNFNWKLSEKCRQWYRLYRGVNHASNINNLYIYIY